MKYSNLSCRLKSKIEKLKTPFFLFDLDIIRKNFSKIKTGLNTENIFFAVKCNSLPMVLQTLHDSGCGFEVNNIAELNKVLVTGISTEKIINSSPITSALDVSKMYVAGVRHYVFDSVDQIENLKHNAPFSNVYLRISTPNEGSGFELSHRLGHSSNDAGMLIDKAREAGLIPVGLIFHVGSQCSNLDNWRAALRECGKLFRQYPFLRVINLGGGFPVNYTYDVPNLKEISECINNAIEEYFEQRPIIFAEPGRYLVGDAAITCSSVLQVENKPCVSRAMIDMSVFTGFIEMLESQMLIKYQIEIEIHEGEEKNYQIIGPTCAGTDIVIDEVSLPTLEIDHKNPHFCNKLFHLNTGAYTVDYISLGQQNGFNGAKLPEVHFMRQGKLLSIEDGLLNRESELLEYQGDLVDLLDKPQIKVG